jgi:hypothetical protein
LCRHQGKTYYKCDDYFTQNYHFHISLLFIVYGRYAFKYGFSKK